MLIIFYFSIDMFDYDLVFESLVFVVPFFLKLSVWNLPFTVTLCSPVPGWVETSTWTDISPTELLAVWPETRIIG